MTPKHDTDSCVPFQYIDDVSIFGVKEEKNMTEKKKTLAKKRFF